MPPGWWILRRRVEHARIRRWAIQRYYAPQPGHLDNGYSRERLREARRIKHRVDPMELRLPLPLFLGGPGMMPDEQDARRGRARRAAERRRDPFGYNRIFGR